MHVAKARGTNPAATPCPPSLARQDAAENVTPESVTKSSKKTRWWRCLVQCFGCCCRRGDNNMEGDSYTPHTPPPPSPNPPGPKPETDEELPLPAPSSLLFPVREEADTPTPAPEGSGAVQKAEGKKNRRNRQRRRAREVSPSQAPTTATANTPASSPAATPAISQAPAPTQAEEREALEDILDLVLLRRGQALTYSRAVYVEGENATDGDGWTAQRDKKARKRRPLQPVPPVAVPTANTSTEAAADGGGWTENRGKRVKGRRPLQLKPFGKAPPAASITAVARQPSRRQQAARDSVWASWQEPQVECTLPVLPHLRRRIVGRGGSFLRDLRREFPAVRVRVPPPQDATSRYVAVEGPRAQAHAALARLRARLQEAAAMPRVKS